MENSEKVRTRSMTVDSGYELSPTRLLLVELIERQIVGEDYFTLLLLSSAPPDRDTAYSILHDAFMNGIIGDTLFARPVPGRVANICVLLTGRVCFGPDREQVFALDDGCVSLDAATGKKYNMFFRVPLDKGSTFCYLLDELMTERFASIRGRMEDMLRSYARGGFATRPLPERRMQALENGGLEEPDGPDLLARLLSFNGQTKLAALVSAAYGFLARK